MSFDKDERNLNLILPPEEIFLLYVGCWEEYESHLKEAEEAVQLGVDIGTVSEVIEDSIDLNTGFGIKYKNLAEKLETILKDANAENALRQIGLYKAHKKEMEDLKKKRES